MTTYLRNTEAMMRKLNCSQVSLELLREAVLEAERLLDAVGLSAEAAIINKLEIAVVLPVNGVVGMVSFRRFQNGWWLKKSKVTRRKNRRQKTFIVVPLEARAAVARICLDSGLRASHLGFTLEGTRPKTTVRDGLAKLLPA